MFSLPKIDAVFFWLITDFSASPYAVLRTSVLTKKKNQPDPDLFSLHLKELDSHIMLGSYFKKCGFTALFCASFFILML